MDSKQADESQPPMDAIDQLKADHKKVKGLFDQFDRTKEGVSEQEKGALVGKIVEELNIHETVENEVFFPAVKQVLRKKDVLEEATVEQEDAGEAIQALGALRPGEPAFDESVKDLGAQIAAHAAEEEADVFPKVQNSEIDTAKLGDEMSRRKAELQAKR